MFQMTLHVNDDSVGRQVYDGQAVRKLSMSVAGMGQDGQPHRYILKWSVERGELVFRLMELAGSRLKLLFEGNPSDMDVVAKEADQRLVSDMTSAD